MKFAISDFIISSTYQL